MPKLVYFLLTLISAQRPGKCPALPYPEFCVSDADECEFDGDCFPGKKCCSNECFNRCVDPLDPLNSDLGQIGKSKFPCFQVRFVILLFAENAIYELL